MIKYTGPTLTRNYNAAGFDIKSNISTNIYKGQYGRVKTGVKMIIPDNMFARIESRSGLAFKNKVTAFNGIIDPDYRGEIVILLKNDGLTDFTVKPGDRIAQIVFYNKYTNIKKITSKEFFKDKDCNTDRNVKGFGSSKM